MRRNILWDFEIHTAHRIPTRRPNLEKNYKKKRTNRIEHFTIPVDHKVKIKENEKKDKYLDLARELKKSYGIWR